MFAIDQRHDLWRLPPVGRASYFEGAGEQADRKAIVCKDLVVWPEPAGNCWDESGAATRKPLAVLEWKARTDTLSRYDEEWLLDFSNYAPSFLGVAISIDPRGAATTLIASRTRGGALTPDWVRFPQP